MHPEHHSWVDILATSLPLPDHAPLSVNSYKNIAKAPSHFLIFGAKIEELKSVTQIKTQERHRSLPREVKTSRETGQKLVYGYYTEEGRKQKP